MRIKPLLACLALVFSAACVRGCPSERPPIHLVRDMDNQPKYLPQNESGFFYNGRTMQEPVMGTVARGELQEDQQFYTGKSGWGFYASNPLEASEETLARGRERFAIYCSPCHGIHAVGQGTVAVRGKIRVANLLDERVRGMADGKIFEVISRGSGLMPAHDYLVSVRDRWTIVAWVRELQKNGGSR